MRRALAVAGVLFAVSGCATPLTPTALSADVGTAFAGRYRAQQSLLGRTDVPAALPARAACRRTGASAEGPGEDWTCQVGYVDQARAGSQLLELSVKADGCWTATAASQPAELVDTLDGRSVTNPLAAFEGCLDTSLQ